MITNTMQQFVLFFIFCCFCIIYLLCCSVVLCLIFLKVSPFDSFYCNYIFIHLLIFISPSRIVPFIFNFMVCYLILFLYPFCFSIFFLIWKVSLNSPFLSYLLHFLFVVALFLNLKLSFMICYCV